MIHSKVYQKFSLKFEETVAEIFMLLSQSLNVRTFFVSRTTQDKFSILKVLNRNGCLIEEGLELPIHDSY